MANPFFQRLAPKFSYQPQFPLAAATAAKAHPQNQPPHRKIVSIPVHFVESEKTKSDTTLKIQKIFRGFLVRKNVKKIIEIKTQVDGIEKKISQRETVDLIKKKGSKERLKLNEMLMSLLFRLDSVRGVDSGVRDLRKSVIKKAIMLQERIDAIVAADEEDKEGQQTQTKEIAEEAYQDLEFTNSAHSSVDNFSEQASEMQQAQTKDVAGSVEESHQNVDVTDSSMENLEDQVLEMQELIESVQIHNQEEQIKYVAGSVEEDANPNVADDEMKEKLEEDQALEMQEGTDSANESEKFEISAMESAEMADFAVDNNNSCLEDEDACNEEESVQMPISSMELCEENLEKKETEMIEGSWNDCNNLMQKMMEKNEKLMGLVTELCENNAVQTEMISSLSQRLGNLERAFKNEKLRRKKKRVAAGAEKVEPPKCGRKE